VPEIKWAGLVGVRGAKSSGDFIAALPRALELKCEQCLGGLGLCVVIMACNGRTCLLRITSPSLLIQPNLRSYSFQLSIPPRFITVIPMSQAANQMDQEKITPAVSLKLRIPGKARTDARGCPGHQTDKTKGSSQASSEADKMVCRELGSAH
jgi:hypothetical protein